ARRSRCRDAAWRCGSRGCRPTTEAASPPRGGRRSRPSPRTRPAAGPASRGCGSASRPRSDALSRARRSRSFFHTEQFGCATSACPPRPRDGTPQCHLGAYPALATGRHDRHVCVVVHDHYCLVLEDSPDHPKRPGVTQRGACQGRVGGSRWIRDRPPGRRGRYLEVPVTGTAGELTALLTKVSVAVLFPAGPFPVKMMLTWQFLPGATATVQVPGLAVKSTVLDRLTAVISNGAVPLLVIVNGLVTDLPMAWVPIAKVGSFSWICDAV